MLKFKILFCMLFLCSSIQANDGKKFPQDVRKFVERRDGCDHFRGEGAYNEERRKELLARMKELCTGTDKHLKQLKKKYKHNKKIMKKLNFYDASIEITSEQGKP